MRKQINSNMRIVLMRSNTLSKKFLTTLKTILILLGLTFLHSYPPSDPFHHYASLILLLGFVYLLWVQLIQYGYIEIWFRSITSNNDQDPTFGAHPQSKAPYGSALTAKNPNGKFLVLIISESVEPIA